MSAISFRPFQPGRNHKTPLTPAHPSSASGSTQYFDIPAANRNIHMTRTNGNVRVGRPMGVRKLAKPAERNEAGL